MKFIESGTGIAIGILIAFGLLAMKFSGAFDRSPESFSREFIGSDAHDCGVVELRDDPKAVDDCVVRQFESATPFYAWYYRRGIDSRIARGIAVDSTNMVYFMGYDSNPSGGTHIGASFRTQRCEAGTLDEPKSDIVCTMSVEGRVERVRMIDAAKGVRLGAR